MQMEKSIQQQKEMQLHKKYKEYTSQLAAHYEGLSAQLQAQLDAAHAQNDADNAQLDAMRTQIDTAHAQRDSARASCARLEEKARVLERFLDEKDDQISQFRYYFNCNFKYDFCYSCYSCNNNND